MERSEPVLTEDAARLAPVRSTPAHLWIVGGLSLLWNAFGAYDYVMTQMNNAAYLANYTAEQRAYFESFPAWMTVLWALGVWGAFLGSILLLARSRYAVPAFGISLFGMLVSFAAQFFGGEEPPGMSEGPMVLMTVAIVAVGVGLLYYAIRQRRNGVLR